jgi:hypothetical protein
MKRWAVAAAVVVATACAPASQSASPSPAPGTSEAGTTAALDFSATLVAGGQLEGGDLQGRDVVLWFWAPW